MAGKSVSKPVSEPVGEQVCEQISEQVNRSVDESVNKSVNEPVDEPAGSVGADASTTRLGQPPKRVSFDDTAIAEEGTLTSEPLNQGWKLKLRWYLRHYRRRIIRWSMLPMLSFGPPLFL